jgi:hypothetical protein
MLPFIMNGEMACAERRQLLDDYRVATSALLAATTTLQFKTGAELRTALMTPSEARAKCVKARLALWDHKANCDRCASISGGGSEENSG